jgi:hypothetical protein
MLAVFYIKYPSNKRMKFGLIMGRVHQPPMCLSRMSQLIGEAVKEQAQLETRCANHSMFGFDKQNGREGAAILVSGQKARQCRCKTGVLW